MTKPTGLPEALQDPVDILWGATVNADPLTFRTTTGNATMACREVERRVQPDPAVAEALADVKQAFGELWEAWRVGAPEANEGRTARAREGAQQSVQRLAAVLRSARPSPRMVNLGMDW